MARTRWPGRFEVHDDVVPIILDGAHNPAGAEALAELAFIYEQRGLDPDLALQSLLEDPCSPADPDACRALFAELRTLQADLLPF